MAKLMHAVRTSFLLLAVFTLLLGVVYPLTVTTLAQLFLPHKANGSLIERGDELVGSALLGQNFSEPKYFWGRLSAANYDAAASTGTNFGLANPKRLEAANARIAALQKADPKNKALIPVDLITASASGLDPHISLPAAQYQASRVARARKLPMEEVNRLIAEHTQGDAIDFLRHPRVNVLTLNLALDDLEELKEQKPRVEK